MKTAAAAGLSALVLGLARSKLLKGGCRDTVGDVLVLGGAGAAFLSLMWGRS